MQKFKLYAIHKGHQTLITSFDSTKPTQINTTITYDEQLSEAENDQFTLTFSMPRFLAVDVMSREQIPNRWLEIVKMGSRLRLIIDDSRRIDLIVSAVAPALSRHNILYTFTAQDEVSYLWSRHNIGYSYPWRDEEDDGPQCIAEYATRILDDNHLSGQWSVMWTPGRVVQDKFSFSIDNSNPYNAMVEAANVLGYKFHVNYAAHTISFYIPEDNKFSGYRYRPETNLKSFSASYDATQLCTIMHAVGGTDAQEQIIPLTPALPHAFRVWFTEEIKDDNGNITYNDNWNDPEAIYKVRVTTGSLKDIPSHRYWITGVKGYRGRTISQYPSILREICDKEKENINRGYEEGEGPLQIDNNFKVIRAPYYRVDRDNTTPYTYFRGAAISGNRPDADQFAVEQLQAEIDECIEFMNIAERVPYLGQFLCDFSFFDEKHSGLLNDLDGIYKILNRMRINNTWLKVYTPPYYNILYSIAKKHAQMETLAEQYIAEWRIIADKVSKGQSEDVTDNYTELARICNSLTQLFSDGYFSWFTTAYGSKLTPVKLSSNSNAKYYSFSDISDLSGDNNTEENLISCQGLVVYPEWQTWITNIDNAEKQYETHQSKLWSLEAQRQARYNVLSVDFLDEEILQDPEIISLDAEIVSETEYIETYKTLKSSWTVTVNETDIVVPGKWSLLMGLMQSRRPINNPTNLGLADKIEASERANARETKLLYTNYGDFIYETAYENTDELDSVGLYNQTVNNFALYNKPAASYSMTTIDLNCLEQISIPNVTVGAKIRVYNEWLNLVDGEIEYNNLQYTNNDLTITAISRKLRSADDVSFTVQKTNRINTLVEKLLINL